jgi:CelD/BcsL family acetyltransferase involved in cellulose biosynthesis
LKDEITVERNGFLVHEQFAEDALREIYRFLGDESQRWEELRLDGMLGDHTWLSREHPELRVISLERQCYFVDLNEVRAHGGGYLGMLSQNSRAQIRRSLKEYSQLAPVRATVAETMDDAFAYLDGLKRLHQAYWTSRGKPGSFSNTFFETFHRRLVRERFEFGEIQLIRIDAGGRDLGYLYNFVYDGRVSNYQSGFDYGICEKYNRPGLVAHAMAVDLNIALEQRIYDFLAGDYQYKRMLGTHSEPMTWIVLQRDRLKFRAEEGLRRLKRRIQGSSRLSSGATAAGGTDE